MSHLLCRAEPISSCSLRPWKQEFYKGIHRMGRILGAHYQEIMKLQNYFIKLIRNFERNKGSVQKPWLCFTCSANSYKREWPESLLKRLFLAIVTSELFLLINGTAFATLGTDRPYKLANRNFSRATHHRFYTLKLSFKAPRPALPGACQQLIEDHMVLFVFFFSLPYCIFLRKKIKLKHIVFKLQ